MQIDIDNNVRMATAVWNAMMLSNLDDMKHMTEDERHAIMQAIYMAIRHTIDPDITLEQIIKEGDKIMKHMEDVYHELEHMYIAVIDKSEDHD
jgi:hypothetical protein